MTVMTDDEVKKVKKVKTTLVVMFTILPILPCGVFAYFWFSGILEVLINDAANPNTAKVVVAFIVLSQIGAYLLYLFLVGKPRIEKLSKDIEERRKMEVSGPISNIDKRQLVITIEDTNFSIGTIYGRMFSTLQIGDTVSLEVAEQSNVVLKVEKITL